MTDITLRTGNQKFILQLPSSQQTFSISPLHVPKPPKTCLDQRMNICMLALDVYFTPSHPRWKTTPLQPKLHTLKLLDCCKIKKKEAISFNASERHKREFSLSLSTDSREKDSFFSPLAIVVKVILICGHDRTPPPFFSLLAAEAPLCNCVHYRAAQIKHSLYSTAAPRENIRRQVQTYLPINY